MPAAWIAWKRILSCKQDTHLAVFDPKASISATTPDITPPSSIKSGSTTQSNKGHEVHHAKKRRSTGSSVCCNDLKNVIHGNTKVMHRGDQDSPLSQHHVSVHQLRVLIRTKEPSLLISPLPHGASFHNYTNTSKPAPMKKFSSCYDCSIASYEAPDFLLSQTASHHSSRPSLSWYPPSTCQKCGDSIDRPEALEEHHATHHAVTELKEGDSARSIVEIIFQTSWLRQDIPCAKPERIFKVHNSSKTISKFEEYREMVKAKASKISKKHSRCLVDGNELLRFYSTTISCHMSKMRTSVSSLASPVSSLCTSSSCGVCHILRHGFPSKGQPGIYTNASSGQAHESVIFGKDVDGCGEVKRAMLVCRVIAGRVKRTGFENSQDGPSSGYDSVAGEAGLYTDLDELLVFNTRAVLPCFVVIYTNAQ